MQRSRVCMCVGRITHMEWDPGPGNACLGGHQIIVITQCDVGDVAHFFRARNVAFRVHEFIDDHGDGGCAPSSK